MLPMIDRDGNGLAFLLSLPRSGSTLLSAIFSGHEVIHAPNEPWILLSLSSIYDAAPTRSGISKSRHDDGWALRAMKDFLTHEQFTRASREFAFSAYQSSLAEAGKTFFIDKTPRYFHILPWIDELFPLSGKIWLKRNPLDVAASYLTTWGDTPEQLTGDPLVPGSYDLTIGLRQLADYVDKRGDVLEVRYEDIAIDPVPILEQVCAHLKVSYQPGMVEYEKSGDFAQRQLRALGDKKLYNHSLPHSGSIGRWEKVLAPAGVQRLVDFLGVGIFERMGYPETVSRLRAMGVRFPTDAELVDRHSEILGKTLDSPVSALEGAINIARGYYREARKRKFPPWFLTREGLRARAAKKKLISARNDLLLLRKQRGEE
jgi:hypothetical protein